MSEPQTEAGPPIYCTAECDACRDYARELGVPLLRSPLPAPEPRVMPRDVLRELRKLRMVVAGLPQWSPHPVIRDLVPLDPVYGDHATVARADVLRVIDEALAAVPSESDAGLDAAWAEAEAALPEGWTLHFQRGDDYGNNAGTWHLTSEPSLELPGQNLGFIGTGPTPAAALRVLAAKLREARP